MLDTNSGSEKIDSFVLEYVNEDEKNNMFPHETQNKKHSGETASAVKFDLQRNSYHSCSWERDLGEKASEKVYNLLNKFFFK